MQTGSSGTLIGWKSGQTTFVPPWDRMEGAWLWTLVFAERDELKPVLLGLSLAGNLVKPLLSLYGTEWREFGYGLRVRRSNNRQASKILVCGSAAFSTSSSFSFFYIL